MEPQQPAVQEQSAPQGTTQIQVNVDYLRSTRVHICMPCYGGMLVAIPTAIPDAPFANKFGNLAGNTNGSCKSPS